MYRKFPTREGEPLEFVVHIPSGQVGAIVARMTQEMESELTVRLPEGNLMVAHIREFRPAPEAEITKRHQTAALTRPLVMPPLTSMRLPMSDTHTGHRPGLG